MYRIYIRKLNQNLQEANPHLTVFQVDDLLRKRLSYEGMFTLSQKVENFESSTQTQLRNANEELYKTQI